MSISLPPGYVTRPPRRDDLAALVELAAAADLADLGEVEYTADDIRGFWDLPGLEMDRDCCLVLVDSPTDGTADTPPVVATADLWPREPGELEGGFSVHPDHRGNGLETWLVAWCVHRAASAAAELRSPASVAVWTIQGGAGVPELERSDFVEERRFLRMTIDLDDTLAPPDPPLDGLEVRPFRPDEHGRVLHSAHEEAFAHHFRHHVFTYEEWSSKRFGRDAFDPGLWLVAWDGDDVAAYVLAELPAETGTGWVSTVGVRPAWRGRGLARALLVRAFGVLHERGTRRVSLDVDAENPTGATTLYERVGMHVSATYLLHRRTVGPPS